MEPMIGKTLGQYQIVEQIGKGGMATVFKAYQPGLDRYVAIKILPAYYAHEAGFAERFTREAQAIAQLDHPNILPVHDFGKEGDISYIVMKYVPAGTLRDKLGQPLPPTEAVKLIQQIAGALDTAHEQGILHRDIKPGNILIDNKGWIYLSDFGLAKMVEGSVKLTGTGVGVGTPAYMSPEQAQGKPVDARTDIYSLGVVLFEMLTGRVPYQADTPVAVVIKHVTDPIPLPRQMNPNLPEAVERVLLKALAKNPEHRFATAGEMAGALQRAVAGLKPAVAAVPIPPDPEATIAHVGPLPASTPPAQPPSIASSFSTPGAPPAIATHPQKQRNIPWALVVAGLLVALIGGGGLLASVIYLLGRDGEATPTAVVGALVVNTAVPASPTATATNSPMPTATQTPTPTDTPLPPTAALTPTFTPFPASTEILLGSIRLRENFTNRANILDRWESFTNDGDVEAGDGYLLLSSGTTDSFPYIRIRQNPFPPAENFNLEIELQYTTVGEFGTGIVLGSEPPENASPVQAEANPDVEHFKIWQDSTFHNALVVGTTGKVLASLKAPDTNRHRVRFAYQDGLVQVYLDGVLVGQEPEPASRPTTLWFGNPYQTPERGNWSELKIFSVLIESSEPLPPPTPTDTPAPTATLTPTRPSWPDTGLRPEGSFANIWTALGAETSELGYPVSNPERESLCARQKFERGYMLWFDRPSDTDVVWSAIIPDPAATRGNKSYKFTDQWPGNPEYWCDEATARAPLGPKRGFGMLWCINPTFQAEIGNATEEEAGGPDYPRCEGQLFQGGAIVHNPLDATYWVFINNGGWRRFGE